MIRGHVKPMIVMFVVAGLIVGGVVGFQLFKNRMIAQSIKGQANPPQTVSTAVAQASLWQPSVEAVGSLSASRQAALSAEVAGLVTAIRFTSGQRVKAGQPLVELNPGPLEAQLAQLEAQAALAEVNLRRDTAQLEVQAVSQATVDTDAATLKSIHAQVAAQKALIAQKTIAAPFAGQLGIRQVNLGQYLAAGTPIVTLQQLDPMDVDFTVPQSQIALIRIGMTAQLESNALPGRTLGATVTAIEPQIDTATRNLKVRARVPNPQQALLPGVFATVRIFDGVPREYVTLPNAAVAYNSYGATVFIVQRAGTGPDGKPRFSAAQRFVTPGPTRGDQVAILKGVAAGETVVTAGQLKLRNGSPVVINNQVQPSNSPSQQVPNP